MIESNEELLSSELEEEHEVSFHPHHVPQTPPNPAGQPLVTVGIYMPYIEGPCKWIGQLMIICITGFSSGALNAKTF